MISSLFNVVIETQRQIYPHSTLSEDRVISSLFNVVIDTQRQIYPPHSTLAEDRVILFTVQCCTLTLKGRYTPLVQHYQRTDWSPHCSMLSLILKGRYTPLVNTIRGQSDLFTVQCCHWHSKADIPPPIQHQQRTECSLHCSMLSLRLKGRYTHIPHYQRTEWSLYCSMLSLRLKGRYTSPHSTPTEDRVFSLLFNVVIETQRQIYPHSTLSEDRVISLLFNVVIETQRQIYPPSFEQEIRLIAGSTTMHICI